MAASKLSQLHTLHLLIVTPCGGALEAIEESIVEQLTEGPVGKLQWVSKPVGRRGYRIKLLESVVLKAHLHAKAQGQLLNIGVAVSRQGGREELSTLLVELEQSCTIRGLLVFVGSCYGRIQQVDVGDIVIPQNFLGQDPWRGHLGGPDSDPPSCSFERVHTSIEQGLMHMQREGDIRVVIAEKFKRPDKFKSRCFGNTVEISLRSDCHFGSRLLSAPGPVETEEQWRKLLQTYPDVVAVDTNSFAFVSAAKDTLRSAPCLVLQMVLGHREADKDSSLECFGAAAAVAVMWQFVQQYPDLLNRNAESTIGLCCSVWLLDISSLVCRCRRPRCNTRDRSWRALHGLQG